MSMSRKDYVAIAAMIEKRFGIDNPTWQRIAHWSVRMFVEELTNYMARENPNFDRQRFQEACGLKDHADD